MSRFLKSYFQLIFVALKTLNTAQNYIKMCSHRQKVLHHTDAVNV